jgi:hypothetical protein
MEVALCGVHADMYPIVAPLELKVGIAMFSPSNLFYTDGSLMDGVAGFAVLDRLQYRILDEGASECLHNRLLKINFQSRNRECWTNGRKVEK